MPKTFKLALASGVAAATFAAGQATAATAATTDSTSATVGEVVITGQKRASTVQNTAATINVITAATLQAQGVKGTTGLQFVTPGLMVSQDLGLQTQIFIRGIGSNLQGIGTGNSVATYVDGVYIPNSIASSQQFTDVERIEVLKGPQATLYGRNATGGAISIVTAEPKMHFGGAVDVDYGNYNELTTHLLVNVPLVADKLAVSVATQTTRHDGYVHNLFDGKYLNYEDVKGVRVGIKAVISDDVYVVLRGDYTDILESDVYKAMPGTSYYYLTPPNSLVNPAINYYTPDPRAVYYNTDNRNPGKDRGVSGTLHWKTPIGNITSVTSERWFNAGPIFADNDQTPVYPVVFGVSLDTLGTTQASASFYHETYLTTTLNGPLNFVAGANYFFDREHQHDVSATAITNETARTSAASVYVDGSFDVSPIIRLVAGVRYSSETKHFTRQAIFPTTLAAVANQATFNSVSPRAGVEIRPHAGLLMYFTATNGFKSGGFNQSNALNEFSPEKIWSYEGGLKTRFWDGRARLATSVFYYDYKDIQVLQYVLSTLPGQTVASLNQLITNAATAKVYGWDLDGDIAATDRLTIGGGLSLLHSEFGSALFCDPRTGSCAPATNPVTHLPYFTPVRVNVQGNPLARAPNVSANLYGEYKIPTPLPGQLKFRMDASYRGTTYFTVFKSDYYKSNPYWLVSANLRYDSASFWFVEAYVKNLANTLAITNEINSSPIYSTVTNTLIYGTPASFNRFAAPRTYGLRIGGKF